MTGERQVVLSVEVQDTDLAEQLALRGFDVVEGGGVNANNYLWRKVNSETVTKSVLGLDT